jgi:hypothetical protein
MFRAISASLLISTCLAGPSHAQAYWDFSPFTKAFAAVRDSFREIPGEGRTQAGTSVREGNDRASASAGSGDLSKWVTDVATRAGKIAGFGRAQSVSLLEPDDDTTMRYKFNYRADFDGTRKSEISGVGWANIVDVTGYEDGVDGFDPIGLVFPGEPEIGAPPQLLDWHVEYVGAHMGDEDGQWTHGVKPGKRTLRERSGWQDVELKKGHRYVAVVFSWAGAEKGSVKLKTALYLDGNGVEIRRATRPDKSAEIRRANEQMAQAEASSMKRDHSGDMRPADTVGN